MSLDDAKIRGGIREKHDKIDENGILDKSCRYCITFKVMLLISSYALFWTSCSFEPVTFVIHGGSKKVVSYFYDNFVAVLVLFLPARRSA